jgi:hypothetical protein
MVCARKQSLAVQYGWEVKCDCRGAERLRVCAICEDSNSDKQWAVRTYGHFGLGETRIDCARNDGYKLAFWFGQSSRGHSAERQRLANTGNYHVCVWCDCSVFVNSTTPEQGDDRQCAHSHGRRCRSPASTLICNPVSE